MTSTSLKTLSLEHVKRLAKSAASATLKPVNKPSPTLPPVTGGNSGVAQIPSLVATPKIPTLSTKPAPQSPRLGESTSQQVQQTAQTLTQGPTQQPAPAPVQAQQAPVQPQVPQPPLGPLGVPLMSKTGFLGLWARSRGAPKADGLIPLSGQGGGGYEALALAVEGAWSEDGRGFGKVGNAFTPSATALDPRFQACASSTFKRGFVQSLSGEGVAPSLLRGWLSMGLRGVKLASAIAVAAASDPHVRAEFEKLAGPLDLDDGTSPLTMDSPAAPAPAAKPPVLGAPKLEMPPKPAPNVSAPTQSAQPGVLGGEAKPSAGVLEPPAAPKSAPVAGPSATRSAPTRKPDAEDLELQGIVSTAPPAYAKTEDGGTFPYMDPFAAKPMSGGSPASAPKPGVLGTGEFGSLRESERGLYPAQPKSVDTTGMTPWDAAEATGKFAPQDAYAEAMKTYAPQAQKWQANLAAAKKHDQRGTGTTALNAFENFTHSISNTVNGTNDSIRDQYGLRPDQRAEFDRLNREAGLKVGPDAALPDNPALKTPEEVWVPGLSKPIRPKAYGDAYHTGLPFDPTQAKEYGTFLQKAEAEGRMKLLPPGPDGKARYKLPDVDQPGDGIEFTWDGASRGPANHAELAESVLKRQAAAYGWNDSKNYGAVDTIHSTASPFEFLIPGAGAGNFMRSGLRMMGGRGGVAATTKAAPTAVAGRGVVGATERAAVGATERAAVGATERAVPGAAKAAPAVEKGVATTAENAAAKAAPKPAPKPAPGTPGNPYSLDPIAETAVAAAKPTVASTLKWTAQYAADPTRIVTDLLRRPTGTGLWSRLSRGTGQAADGILGLPRVATGAQWWRGLAQGQAATSKGQILNAVAPMAVGVMSSGKQGPIEAMLAPATLPLRMGSAYASGDPRRVYNEYAGPVKGFNEHTLQPLDRVTGNAVARGENPALAAGNLFLEKGEGAVDNLRNVGREFSKQQADVESGKRTQTSPFEAVLGAKNDAARQEELELKKQQRDPANPDNQHRLTDRVGRPTWLGGEGLWGRPEASPEVRGQRADAVVNKQQAGMPKTPGADPASGTAVPEDVAEEEVARLENDYGSAVVTGNTQGAKAAYDAALAKAGGDTSRLPIQMFAPPLDHTAFPGMDEAKFGALIDAGSGGPGTFQKYKGLQAEVVGLGQSIQAAQAAGQPVPPETVKAYDEKFKQLRETHKTVQGRAVEHYEQTVLKETREKDLPAFQGEYDRLMGAMKNRAPGAPMSPQDQDALIALRSQGQDISKKYLDHAMRKAAVVGGFKDDGTPIKSVQDFLGEAGKTKPVLGPDGQPVKQMVRQPDGSVVEQPLTEPASPVGKEIKSRIDQFLLAQVQGIETDQVDAQGRPVVEQHVPPEIGAGIFGKMAPMEKMLAFAGLGLGAVGMMGALFGFGGAWMPVLGLLGAAFGAHKMTGGNIGSLFKKDFWAGATKSREVRDGEVLSRFADSKGGIGGTSPIGQVGLDSLKGMPQYADMVAGKMPSRQAVQYLAALQPQDRARFAAELQASSPQSPLLPMIKQVDQFHTTRQEDMQARKAMDDATRSMGAPARPARPGQPAAPSAGVSTATSLQQFAAENGVKMNGELPDLTGKTPAQLGAMVARMSPALRAASTRKLDAFVIKTVREESHGIIDDYAGAWKAIETIARHKPKDPNYEKARHAVQMRDMLAR